MGRIKSLLLILLILGSISITEMDCGDEDDWGYDWDYFDLSDDDGCED